MATTEDRGPVDHRGPVEGRKWRKVREEVRRGCSLDQKTRLKESPRGKGRLVPGMSRDVPGRTGREGVRESPEDSWIWGRPRRGRGTHGSTSLLCSVRRVETRPRTSCEGTRRRSERDGDYRCEV